MVIVLMFIFMSSSHIFSVIYTVALHTIVPYARPKLTGAAINMVAILVAILVARQISDIPHRHDEICTVYDDNSKIRLKKQCEKVTISISI